LEKDGCVKRGATPFHWPERHLLYSGYKAANGCSVGWGI